MVNMKRKVEIGHRVRVRYWQESPIPWDWGSEETITGIVIGLPEPTYQNNWNFNAKEFDLRKDDDEVVHVVNPLSVEEIPPPSTINKPPSSNGLGD